MNQPSNKNDFPSPLSEPVVASFSRYSRFATAGQFVTVVLIWSVTPLAAVWTVHEIHWAWGLFIRFSLAIPIALVCQAYFKVKVPLHPQALLSYAAGALGLFASMTFCYMGASKVPSAIISIIYGIAPFVSGLLATCIFKSEKLSAYQCTGLMMGMLGLYFALDLSSQNIRLNYLGIALEVIAMILYVLSAFAVRGVAANLHPISQMTGATIMSWLGYCALLPFFWSDLPSQLPVLQTSIALIYSALFSSVLAMIFYYQLLNTVNPTTLMLITIMTPVLATLWGTWLNHEALSPHLILGLLLLCMGLSLYSYSIRETVSIK
ncbi:DMT family transporter [Acinetobacter terrae]|jgi:drug/metabolite transporter (DMT)-like permease|uniref:DMT family transporter n=1 Tax=Acinetobacter terrae TaxID=2731247 RepID=UPI0007D7C5B9|nr:DMT family transporter [Acinetobacter terrae]NNH15672.1 DMT family transporter [Acinetobacter terrae]OAL83570.1 multidrug DMT transporter permease [Acinetobacter terrae]